MAETHITDTKTWKITRNEDGEILEVIVIDVNGCGEMTIFGSLHGPVVVWSCITVPVEDWMWEMREEAPVEDVGVFVVGVG